MGGGGLSVKVAEGVGGEGVFGSERDAEGRVVILQDNELVWRLVIVHVLRVQEPLGVWELRPVSVRLREKLEVEVAGTERVAVGDHRVDGVWVRVRVGSGVVVGDREAVAGAETVAVRENVWRNVGERE